MTLQAAVAGVVRTRRVNSAIVEAVESDEEQGAVVGRGRNDGVGKIRRRLDAGEAEAAVVRDIETLEGAQVDDVDRLRRSRRHGNF